jgi:exopolyphosphatase / guanosine-5'-triphosphate,3'-diphosphate pyrophosphatase
MPVFAAVDIGSNSVRIKIAQLQKRRLTPIHEDREVTRLGESVFRGGLLAPEAIANTIQALSRFHRATQRYGVEAVRVVATSALRDARNSRAFVEWVRAVTGWNVEIISGLEEGRLIHLGIVANLKFTTRRVLMIDLGGGSCELTISMDGHIRQMSSLPLGAVRLTEDFLEHDPPKKKELERLRNFILEEVGRVAPRIAAAKIQSVVATSGTAAALAGAARDVSKKSAPGFASRDVVAKLAAKLARASLKERVQFSGIGPRRAEIIVAGAAVFAELMQSCQLPFFRYSPLGLRDGLLAQMAADYDRGTRSRRQVESDRWDALVATGRHYQIDAAHCRQVRDLAMRLFATLRNVHRLPEEYKEWLSAAAMLHEVGSYLNRAGRHRHTYYIIAHSEIFGYTAAQRQIIAAIARYVGNSLPARGDRYLKPLSLEDRQMVPKAVALLRLAIALNQGRRTAVHNVRATKKNASVQLRLSAAKGGADLELWAAEKERAYFRELFGRELVIELS